MWCQLGPLGLSLPQICPACLPCGRRAPESGMLSTALQSLLNQLPHLYKPCTHTHTHPPTPHLVTPQLLDIRLVSASQLLWVVLLGALGCVHPFRLDFSLSVQEWDCWIAWQLCFWFFKAAPYLSPHCLHQFCTPNNSIGGFFFLHTLSSIYYL